MKTHIEVPGIRSKGRIPAPFARGISITLTSLFLLATSAVAKGEQGQDSARGHRPAYSLVGTTPADLQIRMNMKPGRVLQNADQAAAEPEEGPQSAPGRVLVAFQEGVPESEKMNVISRISPNLILDGGTGNPFFDVVHIAQDSPAVEEAIALLRMDPRVRVAELDYLVYAVDTVPNDPYFLYLWGLRNIGQGSYAPTSCRTCSKPGADISAAKAWDITTGSASVIVAVIDSGIDYNHPDLSANIMRDNSGKVVGYDFANKDADPMDDFGHGTHVAGIIGAVGDNGIGIAGVNWKVSIMPVKFLSSSGSGLTSDAVLAIDFAVAHGAQVLSNSWGGGGNSQLLLEAIRRAEKAGVLFVAAAGNSGASIDSGGSYPAGYNQDASNVISVAATDSYDLLASFSSYGPRTCDIAAPGSSIYSTLPSGPCPICSSSGYGYLSGTSMATPYVSGSAALIKARFPQLSLTELKARLLYSADRPAEMDGYTRWGRLDLFNALQTDTVAPGAPSGFAITKASATGLRLVWKASGENGSSGRASAYQIFYNTVPSVATAILLEPGIKPALPGMTETYDLTELMPQTAYYVFLRAVDKVGNTSPMASAGPVTTGAAAFSDGAEAAPILEPLYGTAWSAEAGEAHSGLRAYASPANISGNQYLWVRMIDSIRITRPTYITFWAKTDLGDGEYLMPSIFNTDTGVTTFPSDSYGGVSPWRQHRIDVSAYVGYSIKLGFTLSTRNASSAVVSHRAWIDDIAVLQLAKGWEDNVEGTPQFSGLSPWSITTELSSSPSHAWSDSPNSNYNQNVRLPLMQTSSINLPDNLGAPSIVFKAKLDLEQGRDYLEIYASQDDGANWEYISALTGTSTWTTRSFSLPGWKKVRMMFFLITNEAVAKDGVYLDDIGIWGEPFDNATSPAVSQVTLNLPAGGIATASSLGPLGNASAGYAALSAGTGGLPYGTAVYSYIKDGVVAFEAGVPLTPPMSAGRFFVDSRMTAGSGSGKESVRVDTGFATVNSGISDAYLKLKLRDRNGYILSQGTLRLHPGEHLARFLNQLAPDFVMPSSLAEGLASLEITSDQPVSISASRMTINLNGDFLVSNSPVANLSTPISGETAALPQIVDGGGYQATVTLMNTSESQETGNIRFYDRDGFAFLVRMTGDVSSHSQYSYSIAPGGFVRLVTDGSPANTNVGWALLMPENGTSTPAAAAVLGSTQGGGLVTEAGFPAVAVTTHARIYVDMSNGHDTGIAIGNPGSSGIRINTIALQSDGVTRAGSGSSFVDLPARGHDARFARDLVQGLPEGFTGVLDISSSAPFAAMTIRALTSPAGNFLMTAFPIADINMSPPFPVVFPQVADGGGYQTQIILLSSGGSPSTVTVRYLDDSGAPLSIGK